MNTEVITRNNWSIVLKEFVDEYVKTANQNAPLNLSINMSGPFNNDIYTCYDFNMKFSFFGHERKAKIGSVTFQAFNALMPAVSEKLLFIFDDKGFVYNIKSNLPQALFDKLTNFLDKLTSINQINKNIERSSNNVGKMRSASNNYSKNGRTSRGNRYLGRNRSYG